MASSESSATTVQSYDVFLSFRGEDTRKSFTDHLYSALTAYGMNTFRDDEELEKGGDIASELSRAIQESRIFIIIFSKNYASSKWCLDELAKIIELRTQKKSTIHPVFYHVNPSEVRHQSGSYGEAFSNYEKDAVDQEKKANILKWRAALREAADLSGWHVDNQYETEVIKGITTDIIRRLNREPLHVGKNIVAMDFYLEKLKSLVNIELNTVHVIGIYGIGGIGKTTISKALYNDISYQFHRSCFLKNVRERSKDNALQLQQELLDGILKGKSLTISNTEEGIKMIKNCLSGKRVLVVFDDVDNLRQLEFLAEEHDWFNTKSMIIITTRDKHVLAQYGANVLYEVEKLNNDEAIMLFSRWAFKQNLPPEAYRNLSYCVVEYAKGLPLALKVLGSFFLDKTIPQWEEALRKLRKIPHMEIQNILKISYDGLDDIEKGIFLDIACFFKGEDKDFVSRILDNVYAESGISVLQNKCLTNVLENKLDMHDLVQQMGHEIIRQECPKEPGKWSRLWDLEVIYRILRRNTGTQAIEAIFLDVSAPKPIQFTTEAFKMMNRLRMLKVHRDSIYNPELESGTWMGPDQLSNMRLPEDFQIPSYALTFLHWDAYSLESLPSNFEADNLVELHLRRSSIKQLWEGFMLFGKLKVIDLSYSAHLIKIPDFLSVPNLEILILDGCIDLLSLPSDIYKLKRLRKVSCHRCLWLKSFPEIKGEMKNLTELYLSWTAITELPSSLIQHLKGLKRLDLTWCRYLVHVPKSICGLSSLEALCFGSCQKLDKLPEDLKSLPHLETLELDCLRCKLPSLSGLSSLRESSLSGSNITKEVILKNNCLSSLKKLCLNDCNLMEQGILNHIFGLSSLEDLQLKWNHFNSLPADISKLSRLRSLDLSHCTKLLQIPELPSSLRYLDTHGSPATLSGPWSLLKCFKSAIQEVEGGNSLKEVDWDNSFIEFIPGSSEIPKWINYCHMKSYIEIELPQDWYQDDNFLGLAIGCVYVPLDDEFDCNCENESGHASGEESDNSENESQGEESQKESDVIYLECELIIYGSDIKEVDFITFTPDCECYGDGQGVVSEEMWMMYYPKVAIPENFRSNQWTHFLASFEGSYYSDKPLKVKKCVMDLIYDRAHQNRDLVGNFSDHGNSCSECQLDMVHEFKICLEGRDFNELPTIECHSALESLCLRNCRNLESLPSDFCKLKSLKGLFSSGCSKLKSFPEIMESMENLKELYLDETAIEDLPSSIEHLQGLQDLCLDGCKNLVSLPESICNLRSLTTLHVDKCSKLQKLPENLGGLQSLEELHAACLDSISCHLPSLSGLCSLRVLDLAKTNLTQGAIPSNICCLFSLKVLNLSNCNLIEGGIPSEFYHLSLLQALYLGGNHFSSIPADINKLSELRVLDLSHCQKLLQIPELPSSLRLLDVHSCSSLEPLSSPSSLLPCLFKCFKSTIQDVEGNISINPIDPYVSDCYSDDVLGICISSSSGTPGWIRYKNEGSKVATKLPRNWYKNDDLLGFALCSVHVPPDHGSEERPDVEDTWSLECDLTIGDGNQSKFVDHLSFQCCCNCGSVDDVSSQEWITYYSKITIPRKHASNKSRLFLKAAFQGYFCGEPVKVENCGIHLIYAHELEEPSI